MCRDCESNALYRPNGAAYCMRCSMDTVGTAIIDSKTEMRNRRLFLIIVAPLVLAGLIFAIIGLVEKDYFNKLLIGIFLSALGGVIINATKKKQGITSGDIYREVNRAVYPVSTLIASTFAYAVLGPILYMIDLFRYFEDKKELKNLISNFEARVNEDMKRESLSSEYFVQEINKQQDAIKEHAAAEELKYKKKVRLIKLMPVAVAALTVITVILFFGVESCKIKKEQQEIHSSHPGVIYLK